MVTQSSIFGLNALAPGMGMNDMGGGPAMALSDPGFSFQDQGSLVPGGNPTANMGMPQFDIGGGGMSGMQIAGAGLAGLQTLGALWGAWQQNKMAKKQFKFTKDVTNTNLANQIKSYNTALYDRARSRAVMEGQSDATRDAYIANNSLSRGIGSAHKTDAYTHNYGGSFSGSTPVSGSSVSSLSSLASQASAAKPTATATNDEESGS